ncbi:MAG: nitroreductase family protein [Acidimicrobiales bacterium]
MELRAVMRTTPATREFVRQEIDDEVVREIIDAARFAPSGGNRQPWRVVVVKDPAKRRAIRDSYRLGWSEYMAHVDEGLVPFAPRENNSWPGPAVDLEAARLVPRPDELGDHLDTAPVVMILLARLASLAVTDNGLGRQSIVGGASVYPFAHNVLLAARDAGLGGVMTTVICRQEAAVKELLQVPEDFAVAGLIAMGRPLRQVTRLRRRPVSELVFLDSFGRELG